MTPTVAARTARLAAAKTLAAAASIEVASLANSRAECQSEAMAEYGIAALRDYAWTIRPLEIGHAHGLIRAMIGILVAGDEDGWGGFDSLTQPRRANVLAYVETILADRVSDHRMFIDPRLMGRRFEVKAA